MEHGKHTVRARLAAAAYKARFAHAQPGWSIGSKGMSKSKARLDRQAILLLAVQGLYGTANALSGTFVPVYLWKASQSFALIGWFSLAQHLISGLTFWIAGKWVKRYNKMLVLRAGVIVSGLFYLSVLALGPAAATYVIPLGVLNGIAAGLFWMAYNVIYFEITGPDTRDRFNGWAGLLGSGAGMLAPWVSGIVIGAAGGTVGYRIIFGISLGIFAVATIVSFFLAKRKSSGHYEWVYGFRQLGRHGSPWRKVFPSLVAQGIREGVFMFLLGLLVFLSTNKEQSLGSFTLWTSLTALFSFWLIGRKLHASNRRGAMLIGAAVVSALSAVLFVNVNYAALLSLGIGIAVFMPLYVIPMTSAVFDLIGSSAESAKRREELIVLRECGLIAGRTIGLAVYLVVVSMTQSTAALTGILFAVGAAPLFGWLFIKSRLAQQANGKG